jgi:hypothetical protein
MPKGVTYHESVGFIPDAAVGGTAPPSVPLDRTTAPYICSGTGPPTFAAPKGSLFINLGGSGTANRLYVNTTGSTAWAAVTTAS